MKKRMILAFVLLLVAVVAADAAVVKVKVTTANVRAKPDLMAPVISRASQGALFEVQNKVGTWYEISVVDSAGNIVTGYINQDVVEEVGGGAAAPAKPAPAAPTPAPAAAQPAPVSTGYAPSPSAGAAGGIIIGVGPVFSNLTYDSDTQKILDDYGITKKMKFGFQAGASYELPLGPGFSVMPGVYFSTGGAVLSAEGTTSKVALTNVMIPIEVKVNLGEGPFIAAGPYVGFIVSAKSIDNDGKSTDITDINKVHFGLTLGAGYEMNMGGTVLVIKAAYQLGLSNLAKNAEGETGSMKHSAIVVLLGLKL
jgi:hypothetical protein